MKEEHNIFANSEDISAAASTENTTPTASPSKVAPPVAPKPAWFHPSLKKIRAEQNQRKKAGDSEETRAAGGRSTSGAVNMSIKQKIRSFETCCGAEAADQRASRRSGPQSHSAALLQTESAAPCCSCPPGKENVSDPASGQAKSSEEDKFTAAPPSDTDSVTSDPAHSALLPPKQESEVGTVDVSGVLRAASPVRVDQRGAVEHSGENAQLQDASPSPESPAHNHQEGEHFGKIIAFSNQVSQAIMRSLPTPGHGSAEGQHSPDAPLKDVHNPQDCQLGTDCSNKGFSVSLATLRECSSDQGGQTERAAYAQSVISVIPLQQIRTMIEDVEALDEEALKQLLDIHVVILHKEVGAGLGFSIAGGCDLENKSATVHRLFPGGLAAQEGTIQKGDEVLSINGQTLRGVKHADATAVLRQARNHNLAVVVISKRSDEEAKEGGSSRGEELPMEPGAPMSVELLKGAAGIGFSLEGGKGSIQGDRPLVINRIFKGGAAEQSGLQCGDELLQVQGVSLQDMSRFEAWNMIKALPEGSVTLVCRRGMKGII